MPPTARTFAAALFAAFVALLPVPSTPAADSLDINIQPNPVADSVPREPIPPAPAGHILDQAQVFLPEAATRLGARLAAAKAVEVQIYVVTVRSLKVPSSKQLARLQSLAKDYSAAWLSHDVGAIILFDDESGLVTLELSKETDKRYVGFAVEEELKRPLGEAAKIGLARDKVERFAEVTVEVLTRLQTTFLKEAHRQLIGNLIMGAIALLGVGLAVFSALDQPKAATDVATGEPTVQDATPRADF